MTAAMATEAESIVCSNDTCGQVVALRRHNHLDLLGAELTLDTKGRPVIVCPVCGRFTVVRRTVKDGE